MNDCLGKRNLLFNSIQTPMTFMLSTNLSTSTASFPVKIDIQKNWDVKKSHILHFFKDTVLYFRFKYKYGIVAFQMKGKKYLGEDSTFFLPKQVHCSGFHAIRKRKQMEVF